VALARQIGASGWLGWALIQVGENPSCSDAEAAGEEALALFRALGSEWGEVNALALLANIAAKRRDVPRAAGFYQESLRLRQKIEDRWGLVDILVGAAALAAERGRLEEAAQLLAAGLAWAKDLNYTLDYEVAFKPPEISSLLQGRLSAATLEAAWRRGTSMKPQEAVRLAEALLASLASDEAVAPTAS
jgi:hypothetical protein